MILKPYRLLKYKGMNLFSLLVTLTLFSGIFLSVNQWLSHQRQSAVRIFQDLQAWSIANNQQQRRLMGLNCQSQIEQNHIIFHISCDGNQVTVHYPTGNVRL